LFIPQNGQRYEPSANLTGTVRLLSRRFNAKNVISVKSNIGMTGSARTRQATGCCTPARHAPWPRQDFRYYQIGLFRGQSEMPNLPAVFSLEKLNDRNWIRL
jgi:hypothetical protein